MAPIKVIIIGAGNRGTVYASYAANFPQQMQVVGVAEPRVDFRLRMAQAHSIPAENVVEDWRELAGRPRLADTGWLWGPFRPEYRHLCFANAILHFTPVDLIY